MSHSFIPEFPLHLLHFMAEKRLTTKCCYLIKNKFGFQFNKSISFSFLSSFLPRRGHLLFIGSDIIAYCLRIIRAPTDPRDGTSLIMFRQLITTWAYLLRSPA